MKKLIVLFCAISFFCLSKSMAHASLTLMDGGKSALTLSMHGPADYDWQATLEGEYPILSFKKNNRLVSFGFAGKMQSVGNNHYAQSGMLRDINYRLQPELMLGKKSFYLSIFLTHWSFHKVDRPQNSIPEINIAGVELGVKPGYKTNADVFLFVQARGAIIPDDILSYRRPVALGARIELPVHYHAAAYTSHLAEIGAHTFYRGEMGLKTATQPDGGALEFFGGWSNGAQNISSFYGAVIEGPFWGMRFLW